LILSFSASLLFDLKARLICIRAIRLCQAGIYDHARVMRKGHNLHGGSGDISAMVTGPNIPAWGRFTTLLATPHLRDA
jgi:hypothetical protein